MFGQKPAFRKSRGRRRHASGISSVCVADARFVQAKTKHDANFTPTKSYRVQFQPPHFRHLFVSSSRRLSISVQSHEKTSRRRYNDSLIGVTAFLHLEPGAYSDTCSCNSAKVGVTLRGSACSRLCHCFFTALVIAFDAIILRRLLRGRRHVSIASSKGSTNIPPEMKQVSGHPLRQGDARFSAPRPGRCPPPGRARRSVSQQLAPEVDQYGMAR